MPILIEIEFSVLLVGLRVNHGRLRSSRTGGRSELCCAFTVATQQQDQKKDENWSSFIVKAHFRDPLRHACVS